MAKASLEFKTRLGLGSFVVVADRGMVSAAILQALQDEGIEYVIAERLRRSTANEALARAGRYKKVTPKLEVKKIETEGAEQVMVCRNLERATEDARQRDAIDGKWVLRTTTTLPPEEVVLAYRGLWRVEHAFRTLKTPLELRPLFTPAKQASAATSKPAFSPTPSRASSTTDSTPQDST